MTSIHKKRCPNHGTWADKQIVVLFIMLFGYVMGLYAAFKWQSQAVSIIVMMYFNVA